MKRSVLASVLLSGTVFAILTTPLAVFGSNLINIEFQRENIFVGKLKDIAMPYLGLAGCVSVGAGAVCLSISEWRRSAQKSKQVQTQLVELKTELQHKLTQIDDLRLAEAHLAATGLQSFLAPAPAAADLVEKELQPTVTRVVQPLPANSKMPLKVGVAAEEKGLSPVLYPVDAHPVGELPAVELSKSRIALDRPSPSVLPPESAMLTYLSQLQNQIQQLEAQIATLQSSLQPLVPMIEVTDPYNLELQRLHRRLQLLELDRMRHQNAS